MKILDLPGESECTNCLPWDCCYAKTNRDNYYISKDEHLHPRFCRIFTKFYSSQFLEIHKTGLKIGVQ
jgi:hypothetical protein